MFPGVYTAEVTSLSPKVTEDDVYNFFAYCGPIEHVQIIRSGEYACTAYVTFETAYSLEMAVMLTGSTIGDQRVCITRWNNTYIDEFDPWGRLSWRPEDGSVSPFFLSSWYYSLVTYSDQFITIPGEAVTLAQEVVITMISKGYVLGKDALIKAKELDESYGVSATAMAKVAELSRRIGLTDKIYAGVGAVKSANEKLTVANVTKTAASVTSRTAVAVATAVVNSSYFAKGAMWVSNVLTRAAHAAADLGSRGTGSNK
ncbi:RNA recognition motif domain [Dillenia turbinata]|uniref:RNA recognition motif domain n=1 Tax=Dillenia turbinata TaxID=194707 RepID=A0AAN8UFW6_9MAGN